MSDTAIGHISDTAHWVAVYRAMETKRPDALFRDPLAEKLVHERGHEIARKVGYSAQTCFSVVMRTVIIDSFIRDAIASGTEMVVNLGAGLDTRPYRMDLPPSLMWIEVDYPHMMDLKDERLHDDAPRCKLERIGLDLADRPARQKFFSDLNARNKKTLIVTEGVILYLTEEQAGTLADDLRANENFAGWVTDYYARDIMTYLQRTRRKQMGNSPFQFNPADWHAFYRTHGWRLKEMRYLGEVGIQHNRHFPLPLIARIFSFFAPAERKAKFLRMTGYGLLVPTDKA